MELFFFFYFSLP